MDAAACVFHRDLGQTGRLLPPDQNTVPLGRMVQGVFDQIPDRLCQPGPVTGEDRLLVPLQYNFLSLLFALVLRSEKTTMDASVKTTRLDQQYQQIIDYLKQNYQTADLSSLSDQIHFSKQYICKIVKKKTGDTFNALLMTIRLEMVEQYLLESDLVMEDIAYLCGFTAPSHLSRVFKNHYGISPSAYRKEHKTHISEEVR